MNFIQEGGSSQLKTLDDITMYDNSFAQGATQKHLSSFMNLSDAGKNSKFAVGAAINALGHADGVWDFKDYSDGADSWDGIDLVSSRSSNNHRNYTWSSESEGLLKQYKSQNNGGVDVSNFKYKSSNYQISATKIIGKTLYTNLATGRGERKQNTTRFTF